MTAWASPAAGGGETITAGDKDGDGDEDGCKESDALVTWSSPPQPASMASVTAIEAMNLYLKATPNDLEPGP